MVLSAPVTIILLVSVLMNAVLSAVWFINRNNRKAAPVAEEDFAIEEEDDDLDALDPDIAPETEKLGFEVRTISDPIPGILQGLTVLIADDNEVNIEVLIGMLETMGLERMLIARNGAEAVEASKGSEIDIAYMDIQMPELNGIDASRKILLNPIYRNLPIIPITGFSRIVNAEMCQEAGMTEFLQKPVELDKLRAATLMAMRTKQVRTVA